jgi:hypothetical protein
MIGRGALSKNFHNLHHRAVVSSADYRTGMIWYDQTAALHVYEKYMLILEELVVTKRSETHEERRDTHKYQDRNRDQATHLRS